MAMKAKEDCFIHLVAEVQDLPSGEKPTFYDLMCDAHTHGLNSYCGYELQIVLMLDPKIIAQILTDVGTRIKNGLILHDGDELHGILENDVTIKVFETTDSEASFRMEK